MPVVIYADRGVEGCLVKPGVLFLGATDSNLVADAVDASQGCVTDEHLNHTGVGTQRVVHDKRLDHRKAKEARQATAGDIAGHVAASSQLQPLNARVVASRRDVPGRTTESVSRQSTESF